MILSCKAFYICVIFCRLRVIAKTARVGVNYLLGLLLCCILHFDLPCKVDFPVQSEVSFIFCSLNV